MMFLSIIVTGPEARQFNGPVMLPLWDGQPGMREGQLAYDATGVVDGTPGLIMWNGSNWVKAGITAIPDLQQITDEGASTDNNITTYKTILEEVAQFISTASASSLSSIAALQSFISNPGSGNTSFAQLVLQANVARILVQSGAPLQIYNDAGNKLFEVSANGLSVTFANGVRKITGTGDPNGVETAPPGSSFSRIDGVAGETYYIKQSGTGNTGWAPIA